MRSLALAAACVVCLVAAPLAADEPKTPDPIALARASAEYLVGRQVFSFSWFAAEEEMIRGREKSTHVLSGTQIFRRGVGFAAYTEREGERRDYRYDGKVFAVSAPNEGFFASTEFDGGTDALIAEVRERTGTDIPSTR
jgi:hypothetical protein